MRFELVVSESFSMKLRSPQTKVGTEASKERRDLMMLELASDSPRDQIKIEKLKRGTRAGGGERSVTTKLDPPLSQGRQLNRGPLKKTANARTVNYEGAGGRLGEVVVRDQAAR